MLKVKLLSDSAVAPKRATPGSAAYDLYAAITIPLVLPPGSRFCVPTDIAIQLPDGCYGRIAPRSGLSIKGIDVGAGVIDVDYRGPVGVLLINNGTTDFTISPHDRIAQLLLEAILTPPVEVVDDLNETSRGEGGFGSTGK